MATAGQAEQRISEATGIPLVAVRYYNRSLKQAGVIKPPGSGRHAPDISVTDLVSLGLGIALGLPSAAAENVPLYRSLRSYGPTRSKSPEHPKEWVQDTDGILLLGDDLGQALETLVKVLARPGDEATRSRMRRDFSVTLTPALSTADILWENALQDGLDRRSHYRNLIDFHSIEDLRKLPPPRKPSAEIKHIAVLELPFFECLASLVSDAETASDPSLAGQGKLAALGDQPKLMGLEQSHPTSESNISQPAAD